MAAYLTFCLVRSCVRCSKRKLWVVSLKNGVFFYINMSNTSFSVRVVDVHAINVVKLVDDRYFLYRPDNSGELEINDQLFLTGTSLFVRPHDASFYVQHLINIPQGLLHYELQDARNNPLAAWTLGLKAQFCAYRIRTASIPVGATRDSQVLLSDFSPDTQLATLSHVLEHTAPFEIHKGQPYVRPWRTADYSC